MDATPVSARDADDRPAQNYQVQQRNRTRCKYLFFKIIFYKLFVIMYYLLFQFFNIFLFIYYFAKKLIDKRKV